MDFFVEKLKKSKYFTDIYMLFHVFLSGLIYSLGYKTFVTNGNLYPGGFAGIATLIIRLASKYWGITLSFGTLYFLLNLGPTILVFRYVGKRFAIYSIFHYAFVSLFTNILPVIHLTDNMLLILAFGGFVNGYAISLALKAGASSGGTDFVSIYLSTKTNQPSWNLAFGLNAVVLIIAGINFGWETSLYSILFQFLNTQTINHYHNRYKYTTIYVVTKLPEQISNAVFSIVDHGITKFEVVGEYSLEKKWMLFITVNEFEADTIIRCIRKVDPKSFITLAKTDKIIGNYVQKKYD